MHLKYRSLSSERTLGKDNCPLAQRSFRLILVKLMFEPYDSVTLKKCYFIPVKKFCGLAALQRVLGSILTAVLLIKSNKRSLRWKFSDTH